MNSCRIISGLIAFSALVSPASAQQKKAASSQEKLIANPESNTFSIIEILFRQVRNKGAEQADRADSLKRLESMLTKFLKDYPKSTKGTYAHYMLYETYTEQKNTKKAEEELKTLAGMRPTAKHDNFVAFAAYNLAVRQFTALEAGAADFSSDEESFEILTEKDDLYAVRDALEGLGYAIESAEMDKIPNNYVTLSSEDDIKNMNLLLEHLEDCDDVSEVYHNWEE